MTYGSLFTGIGGIDLGLDRAGMECRWQVENEPYSIKVLERHWPDVKRYGDITKVTGDELEPVDLICGGFPCQDLSQAGKRAGIEGSRSGLWFEYARLLGILRPRYVLIENVPGLLVPGAMSRVVGELARLGYVGCWRSLRASEFGASHLRKRVFLVANCNRRGLLGSIDGPECGTGDGEAQLAGNLPHLAHREHAGRSIIGTPYHHNGRHASGYDSDGRDQHVAHGKSGGLGELRQSSGCNGLVDGSDQELAHSEFIGCQGSLATSGQETGMRRRSAEPREQLAHSENNHGRRGISGEEAGTGPGGIGRRGSSSRNGVVADAQRTGLEVRNGKRELQIRGDSPSLPPGLPSFAPGPSDRRWPYILRVRPDLAPALAHSGHAKRKAGGSGEDAGAGKANGGSIAGDGSRGEPASPDQPGAEEAQSKICRMADGLSSELDRAMSNRTKRLGRLGNSVVPQIAEWIGNRILEFEAQRKLWEIQ